MTTPRLYIGLDAGGSKTELLARAVPGDTVHTLDGPPANLLRQGTDATAHVLATLIQEALRLEPDATLRVVCAGVAGAGREADQTTLADALRARLAQDAPEHLLVVHDAVIALEGAFEGGSGLIVIAGTGSILFGKTTDGALLRAGGWGYLIGDEGSGHALGAHGLRAVAAAYDGGPPTHLRTLLAERHGLDTPEAILHRVYQEGWPLQRLAPLVIEAAAAGDDEARRIVTQETHALARQAAWLARRASALTPRCALLGGLVHEPFYRDALTDALCTELPGWPITKPLHPPAVGALRLALATAD